MQNYLKGYEKYSNFVRGLWRIGEKICLIRTDESRQFLTLPGGSHEKTESSEDALKRKFKEKLGIEILLGDKIYDKSYNGFEVRGYEVYGDRFKIFQSSKVLEVVWLNLEEINRALIAKKSKEIIDKIFYRRL